MGLLNGVMNVANQATSKVGDSLLGADKPVDLEAERNKFMKAIEAQTAGLDKDAKARVLAGWNLAEQGFLMRNAQIQRKASGPLIDWKEAAREAAGGVMVDRGMAGIFAGGDGLGSVLSGAAMDGILAGATGSPAVPSQSARQAQMPLGMGGAAGIVEAGKAGVQNGIAGSVAGTLSGFTSKAMAQIGIGKEPYALTDAVHPERFFGKHPSSLSKRDLYRENGFICWKRIDANATAEAYGPVAGDDAASAAVFNFDPKSESVVAAFRILAARPEDFNRVVEGVSASLGKSPRYASQGSVMRAVYDSGAFVTADAAKVTLGWSQVASTTYASAAPAGGAP